MANILAVLSTSLTTFPMPDTMPMELWRGFMDKHELLISVLSLSAYIAPCVLCFLYAVRGLKFKKDDKEYIKIMVNIPGAFALRGIVGWILSFFFERGGHFVEGVAQGAHLVVGTNQSLCVVIPLGNFFRARGQFF